MPSFRIYILVLLLSGVPRLVVSQQTDHWETIIQRFNICSYVIPYGPVDPGWMSPSFDDSAWESGPGGIGFGDDDDGTAIAPAISVYCRYLFDVPDLSKISALLLDMNFDDGFVAYLNGTELARYNIGEAGTSTSWDQPAGDWLEAPLYRGQSPIRVVLDQSALEGLVNQDNVLAIEVHNQSAASTDLSSNAYLHARLTDLLTRHPPGSGLP